MSRWAWPSTVGLPCLRGPLKRVSGEDALIGPCSGSSTTAEPKPLPTIAPSQFLRARAVVVATSFACVQTGRPRVSTAPCLSNSITSWVSGEGRVPSTVLNLAKPCSSIGALRSWGSLVGEKPPSATMMILPARSSIPCAAAAVSAAIEPAARSALHTIFLTAPLPSVASTAKLPPSVFEEGQGSRPSLARSRRLGAGSRRPRLPWHRARGQAQPELAEHSGYVVAAGQRPAARAFRRHRSLRRPPRGPAGGARPAGAGPGQGTAPRPDRHHAFPVGPGRGAAPASRPASGPDPRRLPCRHRGGGQRLRAAARRDAGRTGRAAGRGDPDRLRDPLQRDPGRLDRRHRARRADRHADPAGRPAARL